ncbi:MAG: hypothetical protein SGI77_00160 [Pirellulaceae bacterium]|nr:hypothetical protein [Pirellulaceae bacterium]
MATDSSSEGRRQSAEVIRIQQLCSSIETRCGVSNFSENLEFALRETGVDVRTISSLKDIRPGDLLIQHEFALYDSQKLKRALKLHIGRKFLFAHSPGADIFAGEVDAFISLCSGMVRKDFLQLVVPHPGWQSPLISRQELKTQFGWGRYDCVIGTNGFITATRQFDRVAARLIAFAVEHNVLIFIACPRHNAQLNRRGDTMPERILQQLSKEYPDHLQMEREFLDQEQLNHRFQACDLLWCWTGGRSAPYGSGTCSDQYGSGTRMIVANKQQHSQVFGLRNVVVGSADLGAFIATLKSEILTRNFARHDPSRLSWDTFAATLKDFIVSVPEPNADIDPRLIKEEMNVPSQPTSKGKAVAEDLTIENASLAARDFLERLSRYPDTFQGRGIAICAGGRRYNTCAWVLVRLLRYLRCQLPIEVWCYEVELDRPWANLLEPYDVRLRVVPNQGINVPSRRDGWRLKSKAILESRFNEVLLLDADNVPVRDPSYLFDCPEYQEKGAVFWPDCNRTNRRSLQWKVFDVPYRDEPEQESGQVLINKKTCWAPLNLCDWYNVNTDFFYRFVYGDKDTFRFAWHRCNVEYAMPSKGVGLSMYTMLQHDFQGKVIFQHRFGAKWTLKRNRVVPGFVHEAQCLEFVDELRLAWQPLNRAMELYQLDPTTNVELENCVFDCVRMGHSSWTLKLEPMGIIDIGRTAEIEAWWVRKGRLNLGTIEGAISFSLEKKPDGTWDGLGMGKNRLRLRLQEEAISSEVKGTVS